MCVAMSSSSSSSSDAGGAAPAKRKREAHQFKLYDVVKAYGEKGVIVQGPLRGEWLVRGRGWFQGERNTWKQWVQEDKLEFVCTLAEVSEDDLEYLPVDQLWTNLLLDSDNLEAAVGSVKKPRTTKMVTPHRKLRF